MRVCVCVFVCVCVSVIRTINLLLHKKTLTNLRLLAQLFDVYTLHIFHMFSLPDTQIIPKTPRKASQNTSTRTVYNICTVYELAGFLNGPTFSIFHGQISTRQMTEIRAMLHLAAFGACFL